MATRAASDGASWGLSLWAIRFFVALFLIDFCFLLVFRSWRTLTSWRSSPYCRPINSPAMLEPGSNRFHDSRLASSLPNHILLNIVYHLSTASSLPSPTTPHPNHAMVLLSHPLFSRPPYSTSVGPPVRSFPLFARSLSAMLFVFPPSAPPYP